MIEKNTRRCIDVRQKIVTSYNHTWHSGIRSEPVNVNKQMRNNYGGKCICLKNHM